MSKYRDKLRIIADILSVTSNGAKKTHIMYRANLSYRLLTRYLTEVMNAGLVRFKESENRYSLTQKGEEFLNKYENYSRHREKLKKQINDINHKRMVLKKMLLTPSSAASTNKPR